MALKELRAEWQRAVDDLNTPECIADPAKYAAKETEIAVLEGTIERAVKAQERAASAARPIDGGGEAADQSGHETSEDTAYLSRAEIIRELARANGVSTFRARTGFEAPRCRTFDEAVAEARSVSGFRPKADKHFRTLGEQLIAVYNHAVSHGLNIDSRLTRAPTGAGEVDPTGGGFLVQVDFAQAIFMLAHDMGELLARVNKIPISEKSNGIKIPAVDETSRVTGSRWGGVQSYWLGEGVQPANTKPKFRMLDFSLHKLFSTMYMTDELLQDQTALNSIMSQAFSEEIMFMTEDAIFEGTGAGMPFGVLNHPSLITVAAETGQTTQTIVKANIDKMWSRCWNRSRKNAVWLINQDIEPQLLALNEPVGSGGVGGTLVYMPPGGMSDSPYAKLYGRPVIATEYNSSLGTTGDIALLDLSQYTLIDKGGVQAATSMHVAFLTDEMVFRITYRVDGKPMWTVPLTPFKGTNTKSPFVALASR